VLPPPRGFIATPLRPERVFDELFSARRARQRFIQLGGSFALRRNYPLGLTTLPWRQQCLQNWVRAMNKTFGWLIVVAVILGAAFGLYLWRGSNTPPLSSPTTASAPAQPAIRHPIEEARAAEPLSAQPGEPLPSLADSDKAMRDALAKLIGRNLQRYFNLEGIIHRLVATVDNLPLGHAPLQLMPVKPVPGWFATSGNGETLILSPKNAARYQPYVRLAESVPTAPLVALYVRFYPLFQAQYEQLGNPGKYFNDRLVQVIDHLLATPEVKTPVHLTQTNVLYQFADPDLEKLSAGQKILVRIGGANGAIVKAKLTEIRRTLVAKPSKG
jgi:hypothetical protein